MIENHLRKNWAIVLWVAALAVNILGGLFWFKRGNYDMATTQESLSNMVYAAACMLIAERYIRRTNESTNKLSAILGDGLKIVGDCSFGIYLTHTLILNVIERVPGVKLMPFPLDAIVAVCVGTVVVMLCKKILGSKICGYLGF